MTAEIAIIISGRGIRFMFGLLRVTHRKAGEDSSPPNTDTSIAQLDVTRQPLFSPPPTETSVALEGTCTAESATLYRSIRMNGVVQMSRHWIVLTSIMT